MCGIAGYVQRQAPSEDTIDRMTDRLAHRGPDGRGVWRGTFGEWSVALGHRRLAIIDIEGGHQPLGNEDGAVQISYNGEVYNFSSLHDDLVQRGHRFATRCDTEVIVHHYEEHGADGLAALDGMFAFAIWDQRIGQLLLARDRVGIKPLYYAPLPDGGLAFASELSALMEHPDVDRALDQNGLASFFFLDYIHPPHTILRAARKLEPANYLTWSAGKTSRPQRYWTLKIGSNRDTGLADTLRDKLHAAVKSQLVSDVPVGVFLSGGIDSSVVATLAQEHSSHPLKTFTIRFDDPEFDESRFARLVSEHIKSEHIEENFDEDSLLANLDDAMSCLDEPLADPSILPTYVLSRLAARHVKVVLGGDGGDELWAGYPTYKAHRLARYYRLLPMALRRQVVDRIVHRLPVRDGYQTFEWKAKRFALRWDDSPALRHLRWMSSLDLPQVATVIPSFEHLPEGFHDLVLESHGDGLNRFLAMDFASYLPGSVLTKVDRASMAHGLEVRPPLLANDLIDFAFSLRGSCKLQGHTGKALLKRAVVDLLPREVIIRRKKGFAIPLSRWLRGPLRQRLENVVRTSPLWETGLLRQSRFIDWLRAHNSYEADYSRPLYALMVLDNWYRRLCRGTGRSLTAVSTVEKEYG